MPTVYNPRSASDKASAKLKQEFSFGNGFLIMRVSVHLYTSLITFTRKTNSENLKQNGQKLTELLRK